MTAALTVADADGPEVNERRDRLADLALGVTFYGWLYGVPFLLGVGLIRRTATPSFDLTYEQAKAVGAVTDAYLIWGLALNAALPAASALAAWLLHRSWQRPFAAMAVAAVGIYLAFGMIGSMAAGPLVGHVPRDQPVPEDNRCVPRSGGHSCPGG